MKNIKKDIIKMKKTFEQKLIGLFAKKTNCNIQHNNCPCNSCFHATEKVDFQHICWLILLGLRGDYDKKQILKSIKEELLL